MSGRQAGATKANAGRSGRPSGRPKGARATLIEEFLKALIGDFVRHGKAAIKQAREQSPVHYLRLIAALVPRTWFGAEPEPAVMPAIVVPRVHQMVRSPRSLR